MLKMIVHLLFVVYTWLIFLRVVGSWFPRIHDHKLFRFVAFYTDPYLNLFRRFIPPIGGVLDLSPMIGFFVLYVVEQILLSILR